MKYALTVLGIIAAIAGIGALISLLIQKLSGRNLSLIIKVFTRIILVALVGMVFVFVFYIIGMR